VLELLALPALKKRWGAEAERAAINLGVLLLPSRHRPCYVWRRRGAWGRRCAWRSCAGAGLGVEYLGAHTGLPFGRYHYTAAACNRS
jgi:uncharacterized membrane protein